MNTRTWAEIDLDALKNNISEVRRITKPSALVTAVVKADAYGHGIAPIAQTLLENGADRLAVACLDEAIQIRHSGIDAPILILGASFEEEAADIVAFDVTPAVFEYALAKKISDEAVKQGKIAKIHIKVDTGMSRIGYPAGLCDAAAAEEIIKISELEGIELEGIFSHLAAADEAGSDAAEYTNTQFEKFMHFCSLLEEKGLSIPIKHIANSAAIMMYPQMQLDMVRAGIILYGFYPSDEVDKSRIHLERAMTLKSRITQIKTLPKGCGVSYGKTYITDKETVAATVPIGYADGYTRMLNGKAKMLLKNERVEVIGRICMDQCMIDVTNVNNINEGDEVIIFGKSTVTADDLANWLNTISYEILCMISKRIPRVYIKEGRRVNTLNYLKRL